MNIFKRLLKPSFQLSYIKEVVDNYTEVNRCINSGDETKFLQASADLDKAIIKLKDYYIKYNKDCCNG